jgi:hypothetical protein
MWNLTLFMSFFCIESIEFILLDHFKDVHVYKNCQMKSCKI